MVEGQAVQVVVRQLPRSRHRDSPPAAAPGIRVNLFHVVSAYVTVYPKTALALAFAYTLLCMVVGTVVALLV